MDYADIVIYYMYALGFWKIIFLWCKSSLGNSQVHINDSISAGDLDSHGTGRTGHAGLTAGYHNRHYRADHIKSIKKHITEIPLKLTDKLLPQRYFFKNFYFRTFTLFVVLQEE